MQEVIHEIPRRLNDPMRMFWWDLDVASLFLATAVIGMMAGFFLSACALGAVIAWGYGRTKSGQHPAFALHLLYWHLPSVVMGLKRTPPSHLRVLVG